MTRVLLVDDQALVRQGLRLILELAGVDVVAEAESHDVRGLVDCAAAWRASSRS